MNVVLTQKLMQCTWILKALRFLLTCCCQHKKIKTNWALTSKSVNWGQYSPKNNNSIQRREFIQVLSTQPVYILLKTYNIWSTLKVKYLFLNEIEQLQLFCMTTVDTANCSETETCYFESHHHLNVLVDSGYCKVPSEKDVLKQNLMQKHPSFISFSFEILLLKPQIMISCNKPYKNK